VIFLILKMISLTCFRTPVLFRDLCSLTYITKSASCFIVTFRYTPPSPSPLGAALLAPPCCPGLLTQHHFPSMFSCRFPTSRKINGSTPEIALRWAPGANRDFFSQSWPPALTNRFSLNYPLLTLIYPPSSL
jgi:hypothetical protein